jgi:asparagine synthase (glutamine-hydrolysing)
MAVSYLLTLGFIPEPRTIWREIRRLPAGHYLTTVEHGPPEIRQYWEPPSDLAGAAKSQASPASAWEALFKEVAQEHLLADTPIALFLSGGLDSTAVAACLHDLNAPLEALTIGFPGAKRDESAIASATATHLRLPHRVIPLDKPDPLALIREVMHAVDEPLGASGPLSKYKICQAAHEADYKVVFGGDGGDEVFCGYPRFWDMDARLSPAMAAVRPLLRWAIERFGQHPALVNPAVKAYGRQDILSRHRWRMFPRYLPEEAERLLSPMDHRFSDADMLAPYLRHYRPQLPPQRAMQRIDLMTYCADGELSRIDKVSMAHSLEWRVPMLDRRVVEFGLSQPYTVGARQESKPTIREYLRSRVPDAVLNAPKRGFSIDNMDQLDRDEARRLIDAGPWVRNGYWRRGWHYLVQPDMPYALARLSLLLMLTLWAENQPCLQT